MRPWDQLRFWAHETSGVDLADPEELPEHMSALEWTMVADAALAPKERVYQ